VESLEEAVQSLETKTCAFEIHERQSSLSEPDSEQGHPLPLQAAMVAAYVHSMDVVESLEEAVQSLETKTCAFEIHERQSSLSEPDSEQGFSPYSSEPDEEQGLSPATTLFDGNCVEPIEVPEQATAASAAAEKRAKKQAEAAAANDAAAARMAAAQKRAVEARAAEELEKTAAAFVAAARASTRVAEKKADAAKYAAELAVVREKFLAGDPGVLPPSLKRQNAAENIEKAVIPRGCYSSMRLQAAAVIEKAPECSGTRFQEALCLAIEEAESKHSLTSYKSFKGMPPVLAQSSTP